MSNPAPLQPQQSPLDIVLTQAAALRTLAQGMMICADALVMTCNALQVRAAAPSSPAEDTNDIATPPRIPSGPIGSSELRSYRTFDDPPPSARPAPEPDGSGEIRPSTLATG